MSHTEVRAIRPAQSVVRPVVAVASLLLLLAVVAVVLFTMLRSPLKDDVAWLLYVARRWLAGRELYIDVVEINPPLIVWISAIPIQLASVLGIDAQYTAIPFFVAAVLGCAWWTASLLQGSGRLFDDRLPVFAAIGTVLLVVPAGDLGQREHLLVAAILPYLALFARSLDGERAGAARVADRRRARRPRLRAEATLCRRVHRARGAGAAPRPAPVPRQAARRRRPRCWSMPAWWRCSARPICAARCRWRWRCMARPTCRSATCWWTACA